MNKVLTALLTALLLAGCSGGGHEDKQGEVHTLSSDSIQDQVLDQVHTKAPSWFDAYSDTEVWQMVQHVCGGDMLEDEAGFGSVQEEDRGFLVGISLSAVC